MITRSAEAIDPPREGSPARGTSPEARTGVTDTGAAADLGVDGRPGAAPGLNRFTLDELLAVYDLAGDVPPVPARCLPSAHGGILGAQMLGQQIVLAERMAPGKQAHTVHAVFMRSGDCREPVWIDVERLAHGRSVDSLALTFRQGTLQICRSDVMLRAPEPDFLRLETSAFELAGAGLAGATSAGAESVGAASVGAGLAGPEQGTPVDRAMMPWEVRVLPRAGVYQHDHWQRIPAAPEDPSRWRALLAQTCEVLPMSDLLTASGIPTMGPGRAPGMVLSQTVTFYDDLDVRDWHLFRVRTLHAGHGRAVGRVEVFDRTGKLCVGSEAVGVVRAPRP